MFPSPIGELHFSIRIRPFLPILESWFPSPIGELHFSIRLMIHIQKSSKWFPSPIGELHFSIIINLEAVMIEIIVSVPYRGATFLNNTVIALAGTEQKKGFRPLSGSYISQLSLDVAHATVCRTFPSPIGELHFSMLVCSCMISALGFRPLSGSYISQ